MTAPLFAFAFSPFLRLLPHKAISNAFLFFTLAR